MSFTIPITVTNVDAAGGVEEAIIAYAAKQPQFVAGVIRTAAQRKKERWYPPENLSHYAREALLSTTGAVYFVDCETGLVATLDGDGDADWSADSKVRLICPDFHIETREPDTIFEMFQAAVTTHKACSKPAEWWGYARAVFLDLYKRKVKDNRPEWETRRRY